MNEKYDAIVVGAGPGGSSAALGLARHGAKVLLLDKFDFPRDKPCGDFIGRQAYALALRLGVPAARFAEYPPLAGVQMRTPGSRDLRLPGAKAGAGARIIPRRVFDTALVELALEAGATFRHCQAQRLMMENGQTVGVAGREGEGFFAPLVIGADGWSSIIARGLGLALNERATTGVAIRAYFEGVRGLDNMVAFHFPASILPGYGWLFPVGCDGCANVGLGLIAEEYQNSTKGNLTAMFEDFIARTEQLSGAKAISKNRSWPLALGWQHNRALFGSGAMLVGDAACLVGPLTGAGIYPAMRSGLIAAEVGYKALAAGEFGSDILQEYEQRVKREFRWRLRTEETAQKWLRDPAHMDGLLKALPYIPFSSRLTSTLLFNLG
jgi:geranylgeranyl reductase family protein